MNLAIVPVAKIKMSVECA